MKTRLCTNLQKMMQKNNVVIFVTFAILLTAGRARFIVAIQFNGSQNLLSHVHDAENQQVDKLLKCVIKDHAVLGSLIIQENLIITFCGLLEIDISRSFRGKDVIRLENKFEL